jgi:hypothetical protein
MDLLKQIRSLLWLRLICAGKAAERCTISCGCLLISLILSDGWNGLLPSRHAGALVTTCNYG